MILSEPSKSGGIQNKKCVVYTIPICLHYEIPHKWHLQIHTLITEETNIGSVKKCPCEVSK